MTAKDRFFTQFAARAVGWSHKLENDRCPMCGHPAPGSTITDSLSQAEFKISGLCQRCQNHAFGPAGAP